MTVIPGLPIHLQEVPAAPASPDATDGAAQRQAWLDWRNDILRYRVQRRHELDAHPDLIPFEVARCAAHPAYFAAVWMSIFEPRTRATGTGYMPFVPFAKQVDVMDALLWTLGQTDENADAVWSKCRGWGASWIGCLLALWGWLFSDKWATPMPWNGLLLSRKEELVDSKKQRSLFWKIDRLLRDTPIWAMPKDFDWAIHRQKNVLINPVNGNELGGEATTSKSGRGDRVTWCWLDEAAAMPEFLQTWSTVAETTDHRWAVSTENMEEGPDFYNLRTGSEGGIRPHLIESDWWENPLNDNEWFERQKLRYAADPDAFTREILRDPHAGTATWVYPRAWEMAPDPNVKPIVGRPSFVTVDPGFNDETVLIAAQENDMGGIDILDAYANNRQPAAFYVPLLKPELLGDQINYDHARWTPEISGVEPVAYDYGTEELAFARTIVAMGGKPTYVGDTYGDNVTGATADSVYSIWERFQVYVNRDRRGEKDLSAYARQARTFKGRREALSERVSRWRFGTTVGAARTLKAVQNNRYKPKSDRPTMSEAKVPLHDWTSHYVTALEYLAVHLKQRTAVLLRPVTMPTRNRFGTRRSNLGRRVQERYA
jgi:hypothetical protein